MEEGEFRKPRDRGSDDPRLALATAGRLHRTGRRDGR